MSSDALIPITQSRVLFIRHGYSQVPVTFSFLPIQVYAFILWCPDTCTQSLLVSIPFQMSTLSSSGTLIPFYRIVLLSFALSTANPVYLLSGVALARFLTYNFSFFVLYCLQDRSSFITFPKLM